MKFNKMAACLIATACAASTLGAMTSVSAAESITIKAGTVTAKAGETFKVNIELSGVPSSGIAGLDFSIKYDSTVFEVTGCTEGNISKTNDKQVEGFTSNLATNIASGSVSVLWATGQIKTNDSWIKSDGVLLTLECKALKNGSSSVEIVPNTRKDATTVDVVVDGLTIVNPTIVSGKVTVADEQTTTQPPVSGGLVGDVTLDGSVDLTDLTTLALHLLKDIELTGQALKNADVKADGEVNLADLASLKTKLS